MPQRTRTVSQSRQRDRWLVPLPHPSWSGEAARLDRPQPLIPAEFWKRLGL